MRDPLLRLYMATRDFGTALKTESGTDFVENVLVFSLIALGTVAVTSNLAGRIVAGLNGVHDIFMGHINGGASTLNGG
jgi:hydrogenase/urease accessory protein HupE